MKSRPVATNGYKITGAFSVLVAYALGSLTSLEIK